MSSFNAILEDVLAEARSRQSDVGVSQLKKYLSVNPDALSEALPVLYHHLDPRFIPSQPTSSPENIRSLDLAGLALITLLQLRTEQILGDNALLDSALAFWPVIWKWVEFFMAHRAALALLPLRTFLRMRNAVLVTCRDGTNLSPRRIFTPHVLRTIFLLWTQDKHNPKRKDSQQLDFDYSTASVIKPIVEFYDAKTKVGMRQEFNALLLAALEENSRDIATTAVARLRYSSTKPFATGEECMSVLSDLQIVESLMKCSDLVFHEMLSRRLIPVLTTFLMSLTSDLPLRTYIADTVCGLIIISQTIVMHTVQSPHNNIWLLQAFEGRILLSTFQALPWIRWQRVRRPTSPVEQIAKSLLHILRIPLIHLEMYRAARRSMGEIVRTRLDGTALLDMRNSWTELKDLIRERQDAYAPDFRPQCGNSTCESTRRGLMRCGGCLTFYYCSRACQRHDWLHGGHRLYCVDLQLSYRGLQDDKGEITVQAVKFMLLVGKLRLHLDYDEFEDDIRGIQQPAVPVFLLDHTAFKVSVVPSTSVDQDDDDVPFHHDVSIVAENRGKMVLLAVHWSRGSKGYRRAHRAVYLPKRGDETEGDRTWS